MQPHCTLMTIRQSTNVRNACAGVPQVVSDMPPHRSLRGAEAVGGGRTFDDGCRGVGGNWAIPTCSVGASPPVFLICLLALSLHLPSSACTPLTLP